MEIKVDLKEAKQLFDTLIPLFLNQQMFNSFLDGAGGTTTVKPNPLEAKETLREPECWKGNACDCTGRKGNW